MITHNLRINQLSAQTYERYFQYLQVLDNKDVAAYGRLLADNVEMYFNNQFFGKGKEAILQGLSKYWQSFDKIEHDLTNIYGSDKNYLLEALNHYVRLDGKKATVRAVAFTDLNEAGLVESVRTYMDISPIFT